MKTSVIVLLALSILFASCKKLGLCKDGEFTFERTEILSQSLRLDGYYYSVLEDYPETAKVLLLYTNGVAVTNLGVAVEDIENNNVDLQLGTEASKRRSGWGIFRINGIQLEIQSWLTIMNSCKPILLEKGVILNDTTFKLTSSKRLKRKKEKEIEETFRFVAYSPKPDSTNDFIE